MDAYVHIGTTPTDFTNGLQTIYSPNQIANGAASFVQNVDFNRLPGSLSKRKGHTVYSCGKGTPSNPIPGFVNGLHQFVDENQNQTLFAAYCGTDTTMYDEMTFVDADIEEISFTALQPYNIKITNHGLSTGTVVDFANQGGTIDDIYQLELNSYQVTVVDADNFTLDGTIAFIKNIEVAFSSVAPDPNYIGLRITNHNLMTGDTVTISNLSPDLYGLNNNTYTITVLDTDNFTLDGVVATSETAYTPTSGVITEGPFTLSVVTQPSAGSAGYYKPVSTAFSVGEHIATVPSPGSGSDCFWTDVYPSSGDFNITQVEASDFGLFQIDELSNSGVHTPFIIEATGISDFGPYSQGQVGYFTNQSPDSYGIANKFFTLIEGTDPDIPHLKGTFHASALTFKFPPAAGQVNVFADDVQLTTSAVHHLTTGDKVLVTGLSPDTFNLNDKIWTITVTGTTKFTLDGSKTFQSGTYAPSAGMIQQGSPIACANINFVTFANICIAFGVEIPTIYWYTGITPNEFIPLTGTPPANAKYGTVFQNSVFLANTSAGSSRLHWCAPGNPFDWTTINQAGFIDVNPNDGDFIVGLVVISGYLFILKQHSVYALSGTGPTTYQVVANPAFDGCAAPRSIVNIGTFFDYLSTRAVLSLAPGAYTTEQSLNIKPNLEGVAANGMPAITADIRSNACAGLSLYQYWLAFDADGDGKNDSAYVFDYVTGCWTYYNNINANVFTNLIDKTLIAGASDSINVYVYQQGEIDYGQASNNNEGQSIPMVWVSKEFDSVVLTPTQTSDYQDIKTLQDIAIRAPALAGGSVVVDTFINGADQADPITISLDATATTGSQSVVPNSAVIIGWSDMLTTTQGNTFQIQLSDNTPDSPVVVNSIQMKMDVQMHMKWGAPAPSNPAT